ncbi:HNH/ENDO VII family nuclease [Apibacter raozihei]|uniref:HNH/ENDO VII family nuclease n=1 Tax=Apibacter raozihei TaxID=2500547 RepID=UPI000FE3E7E9|nr:HNH/ENDO VII family nuclease [Apibacter raozihei]
MDSKSNSIHKIKATKPNMDAQDVAAKYNAGEIPSGKNNPVASAPSNNPVKIKAQAPDVSAANQSVTDRISSSSVNADFKGYAEQAFSKDNALAILDNTVNTASDMVNDPLKFLSGPENENAEVKEAGPMEKEETEPCETNPVKVKATKYKLVSTARQHVSKHFDIVLGIDLHWTVTPLNWIPLPLPHPFIGIVIDPMDYIHFNIPVPQFLQDKFSLPANIPMGGSIYVHGRHKATTTTSVAGVVLPFRHVTELIPVYQIVNKPGAPHDGEVYWGSPTVLGQGSEMSGSDPQQVLTCWCPPMGLRWLPTAPNKPTKNPLAFMSFYSDKLSMYVQINTGNPVLVGGQFKPHKYTATEMLMRFAAMALMKSLTFLTKMGLKKFNHLLQGKFGAKNPISRALCKLGLEPVNFVTGAMSFEWEDFELLGSTSFKWSNIWESDTTYSGMLGNGVSNSYDLFIIPQEQENVVAFHHPGENQTIPIPYIEPGADFEYYRAWKLWQKRPHENCWIIKLNGNTYTYKAFFNPEFGKIFRVETIEYADGGVVRFRYDPRGNVLSEITDRAGRKLLFSHNSEGNRITSVKMHYKDRDEILVRYEYDTRGNLIKVIDPAEKSIDFHYDSHNRVVRRKNRNGMEYSWEYDKEGRVVYTSGKNGFQEGRIQYFPEEGYNEVYYTQKEGKVERYYYDEENRVYKEQNALGGETWYDYTKYNERTMVASPEGKVAGYAYDELGNIKTYQTPDGEQFIYKYDHANRLVYRKEPSGLNETWEYDEEGRLSQWKRLDESLVDYFYEQDQKQPSFSRDSSGLETHWEYNDFGQVITVYNNRGSRQEFRYDSFGRLVSQNRENEAPTVWKRDRMGRVREFTTSGQKPLRIQYDAYDLPVNVSNGSEEWFMEYTPMGSLKKQSRRSAKTLEALSTLKYDYNAYEQLYRIINEKQEEYTFTRDLNDQVIQERDFDGQKKEFIRNRDGEIIRTLLPGGRDIIHEYDAAGRLTYNRYTSGFWESFEYDKTGLLVKADNLMSETEFIRNPFGQIVQEKQGEHLLNYIYDEMGRLTTLKSSLGAEVDYSYGADGNSLAVSASTEETRQHPFSPFWKSEIHWAQDSKQVRRTLPGNMESLMEYDELGRPVSQKVSVDNRTTTLHSENRWKENFKLAETLNRLTGGSVRYDYDAFGSLAAARYEDGTTEYKNPDETGNLYNSTNRKDRTYNRGGKLLKDKDWYYHYNEQGNLRLKSHSSPSFTDGNSGKTGSRFLVDEPSQKSEFTSRFLLPDGEIYSNSYDQKAEIRKYSKWELKAYDKLRNQQEAEEKKNRQKTAPAEWQPGDWEYLWYSNGMLRQVKKPDASLVRFEYDALGRRTAKIVEDKTSGNKIFRYIWEGNVLLHEWSYALEERPKLVSHEDGTIGYDREEPVEDVTTWIYERGSFTPCAKLVGKEKYSIVSDYLGRPLQAYDAQGGKVWEAVYDIYGGLRNIEGGKGFIPFRQAGQYEDVETGLYYNRFRYYSPQTGAYLSKDPIGLAGDNPNAYAYTYDSNTELDPLGLDIFNPIDWTAPSNGTGYTYKVYQQNIDWDMVDPKTGLTNLELATKGNAPIGVDGKPINLHHSKQQAHGPLFEISQTPHQTYGNTNALHPYRVTPNPDGTKYNPYDPVNRKNFGKDRKQYWKDRAKAELEARKIKYK